LKFNQSFEKIGDGGVVMRYRGTLVARFASKLVVDILPATAASLIGGLLFTHYGLGRVNEPAAQVAPASAEMMQLLRDEHGLMVRLLDAQIEREKTKLASEDSARRESGEAVEAAAVHSVSAQLPAGVAPANKPGSSRSRTASATSVSVPSAPLVIAQAQPAETINAPAPASQMLLARTIGLKDHVVSVTHRVVSVFGGIPGWIGRFGDHLGGSDTRFRPAPDAVAAS
jgi:hypothetical protein